MSLNVEILTPSKNHRFEQASEVIAPGQMGEVGVLPGHADYLTSLQAGPLTVIGQGGQKHSFQIDGGLMTVSKNKVAILVENVEQK